MPTTTISTSAPSPSPTVTLPGGGIFPGPGFPGNTLPSAAIVPFGPFDPFGRTLGPMVNLQNFPFNQFFNGAWWNWIPHQRRWVILNRGQCAQWSAPIHPTAAMLQDATSRLSASRGAAVSVQDSSGTFYLYSREGGQIVIRACVSQ